jgi:hypothetical protein
MATMNNNSLALNIFASTDIENFSVLNVYELLSLISKDLEPSRVGAPDLHVVGLSCTLNIPRLVVQSCSDGTRLLMEVPDLSVSSVWCLDDHVSVIDKVKVSVFLHLGDNVEIFLDNKAKLFIHFTFDWISFPFINIDNIPLLMKAIVSVAKLDISILLIKVALNFNSLSSDIDDVAILVSEHLPPSGIGTSNLQVPCVAISTDL